MRNGRLCFYVNSSEAWVNYRFLSLNTSIFCEFEVYKEFILLNIKVKTHHYLRYVSSLYNSFSHLLFFPNPSSFKNLGHMAKPSMLPEDTLHGQGETSPGWGRKP